MPLTIINKDIIQARITEIARYLAAHHVEDPRLDSGVRFSDRDCPRPSPSPKAAASAPHKMVTIPCATEAFAVRDLDHYLKRKDAGFMETLLDMIQKSGQKNSDIYHKANITRQHFSKLVTNPSATVTKPVAVALTLALEMDLEQTQALLKRAGYTLTDSSVFDLIIKYHIENKIYNVPEINIVLYQFDQMLLGS